MTAVTVTVNDERLRRSAPETATATVTDNLELVEVVFYLDGTELGRFSEPPFQVERASPKVPSRGRS